MQLNYKIVVTGGSGRFGSILQKKYKSDKLLYPSKEHLNILSAESVEKYLKKTNPKILIHLAGLSRPMKIHDNNISKSIDLNIIGTANIVKICSKLRIKLIYFSTNYIYQGKKGNYKETDPLLPVNNFTSNGRYACLPQANSLRPMIELKALFVFGSLPGVFKSSIDRI